MDNEDSEAVRAMKIYQKKHGGNLAEISILFVNVVSALKEAAQQPLHSDVCPVCHGKKYVQTKTRGLVPCASCGGQTPVS